MHTHIHIVTRTASQPFVILFSTNRSVSFQCMSSKLWFSIFRIDILSFYRSMDSVQLPIIWCVFCFHRVLETRMAMEREKKLNKTKNSSREAPLLNWNDDLFKKGLIASKKFYWHIIMKIMTIKSWTFRFKNAGVSKLVCCSRAHFSTLPLKSCKINGPIDWRVEEKKPICNQ